MLDEKIIRTMTDILEKDSRLCAAFLHGSYAKGNAHKDSDIDIAILPFNTIEISNKDRLDIYTELAVELRKDIDLGVLSELNLVYAKEVIEHGILLFSKDQYYTDTMIMLFLSQYARLNEERKEVLNAWRL